MSRVITNDLQDWLEKQVGEANDAAEKGDMHGSRLRCHEETKSSVMTTGYPRCPVRLGEKEPTQSDKPQWHSHLSVASRR